MQQHYVQRSFKSVPLKPLHSHVASNESIRILHAHAHPEYSFIQYPSPPFQPLTTCKPPQNTKKKQQPIHNRLLQRKPMKLSLNTQSDNDKTLTIFFFSFFLTLFFFSLSHQDFTKIVKREDTSLPVTVVLVSIVPTPVDAVTLVVSTTTVHFLISFTLVFLVKLVCVTTTSNVISLTAPLPTSTNFGQSSVLKFWNRPRPVEKPQFSTAQAMASLKY